MEIFDENSEATKGIKKNLKERFYIIYSNIENMTLAVIDIVLQLHQKEVDFLVKIFHEMRVLSEPND